jgi:ribosomal protein S18 acetylase RimI-like enzyme
MKTNIRNAKNLDLNEFIIMKNEYIKDFSNISGETININKKQIINEFEETLKKRNTNIIMIEVNKEIVGFMKLNWMKSKIKNFAYLEDIFVKEKYQGKGYGKKLFREFMKIGKEKKVEKMGLGTRIENKRAIEMYKKYGFEIIGYNFGKKI